jgi:hypothetical protein
VPALYLESLGRPTMKPRGMVMIGALVRDSSGIMKIVTGYKCDARDEMIQFAGEHKAWHNLDRFEILSLED